MADLGQPLSTWQILKAAGKTPTRNWAVLRPLLLASFLDSFISFLYFQFQPPMPNIGVKALLTARHPRPITLKGYGALSNIGHLQVLPFIVDPLVIQVVPFIVSSFVTIAIIGFTAVTYSGEQQLSLKGLVTRIRTSSAAPIVTLFYIEVLGMIVSLMFSTLAHFLNLVDVDPLVLRILVVLLEILENIAYFYLITIWDLATVVPVVDAACYGRRAVGKAKRLVRGKWVQGLSITVLIWAIGTGLDAALGGAVYASAEGSPVVVLVVLLVALPLYFGISAALTVFSWAARTVFYYECEERHGGEISTDDATSAYVGLPSGDARADPAAYP